MRPRIRTIKPEIWADEKIGRVSRDARLLFVGLITLADDEGRFRALPSAILGHVFPYDGDAPKRFGGWLGELVRVGLVRLYEVAGVAYGCLPHWTDHQKINRAKSSVLPAPSVSDHGDVTDDAGSRAQARAPADRITTNDLRNGTTDVSGKDKPSIPTSVVLPR